MPRGRYVLLTMSEVLVSVTGLEFSYTQAPKSMKSLVMSLWLLAGDTWHALLTIPPLVTCGMPSSPSRPW